MNKDVLVSIIIPAYNADAYIRRCLESVIHQTYRYYEVIIINDGSTDNTLGICKEYASLYGFRIINQNNSGVAAARNRGIEEAKGEYILFIDADDWIEEKHVESLVNARDNKLQQVILCGYKENYSDKMMEKRVHNEVYFKKDFYKLIDKWGIDPIVGASWNKLIKKDILISNKVFFPVGQQYGEDFTFCIDLLDCVESIKMIDLNTYNYSREAENSLSKINYTDLRKWWTEEKRIYEKLNEEKYLDSHRNTVNRIFAYFIGANLVYQIKQGEVDKEFLEEVRNSYLEVIKKTRIINSTWKMNLVYNVERLYVLNLESIFGDFMFKILTRICRL